ncbi:MAG: hypothetical protein O7G85_12220 [Planctomycetota bacterium]|nr:hypothetical protein [Planctomycetota bacterium]
MIDKQHSLGLSRRCAMWLFGALLMPFISGCATTSQAGDGDTDFQGYSNPVLRRFSNVENGLEVRRWIVQGDLDRIGQTLADHESVVPIDESLQATLRRNGLRLRQVPIEQLESIETDLAPLALNRNEWHGQITEWSVLHEYTLANSREIVAINGRVHSYEDGKFQLMARSWVVQMEDGPFLHLDIIPCFVKREPTRVQLIPQDQVHRYKGSRFDRLRLTMRLDPKMAYILTCESPGVAWPDEEGAALSRTAARSPSRRRGPGPGPVDVRGPDSGAPKTLGTLLLNREGLPPSRGVLVFIARISPDLSPAPEAKTRTASH